MTRLGRFRHWRIRRHPFAENRSPNLCPTRNIGRYGKRDARYSTSSNAWQRTTRPMTDGQVDINATKGVAREQVEADTREESAPGRNAAQERKESRDLAPAPIRMGPTTITTITTSEGGRPGVPCPTCAGTGAVPTE